MPAQRRRWHTMALVVVAALAGPFRSSASILAVALRHVPLCSGLGRYASGLEWLETEHRAAIENQKAMQKVPSRTSAAQMSLSGEGGTARVGRCLIAAPQRPARRRRAHAPAMILAGPKRSDGILPASRAVVCVAACVPRLHGVRNRLCLSGARAAHDDRKHRRCAPDAGAGRQPPPPLSVAPMFPTLRTCTVGMQLRCTSASNCV